MRRLCLLGLQHRSAPNSKSLCFPFRSGRPKQARPVPGTWHPVARRRCRRRGERGECAPGRLARAAEVRCLLRQSGATSPQRPPRRPPPRPDQQRATKAAKERSRCSKEELISFYSPAAHPSPRAGARRSGHWWRKPGRHGEAALGTCRRPQRSYPSKAGAAAASCGSSASAASASSSGPRLAGGTRRLHRAESAGTPQREPRKSQAPRARWEPTVNGLNEGGLPAPAPAGGPGATVPPRRRRSCPARIIRARLEHRAIITGARGDVTRTPAPSRRLPEIVAENCRARAAHTAYTHCARCLPRTLAASALRALFR